MTFTFTSDEWNGVTEDNQGNVRPLLPETFTSFSEAEEDNGQSRIYLGIHFSFDKTAGIVMGNQIGDYDYDLSSCPWNRLILLRGLGATRGLPSITVVFSLWLGAAVAS